MAKKKKVVSRPVVSPAERGLRMLLDADIEGIELISEDARRRLFGVAGGIHPNAADDEDDPSLSVRQERLAGLVDMLRSPSALTSTHFGGVLASLRRAINREIKRLPK